MRASPRFDWGDSGVGEPPSAGWREVYIWCDVDWREL